MALDAGKLGKDILGALKAAFQDKWPEMKEYGEAEAKKLAQTLVMIEALRAAGKISEEQAQLQLNIQKNASRTVLLTLEGLGLLAAEAAINAALDVVKEAVNTAVGFVLV